MDVSLDLQYFSPRNTPCTVAVPLKRTLAKFQASERAARSSRPVLCLSSAAIRLQEPFDIACRPFLRVYVTGNDDINEDEANEKCEPSSNGFTNEDAQMHATSSKCSSNIRESSNNGTITHFGSLNAAPSFDLDSETSLEVNERERLRRKRIGLANKGKTPWNKGKHHSPETIARLKERNKIVMQDPKIREKLRQYSHPQSEETREKIRIFMKSRMELERRQFSVVQEWKDSVASLARRGIVGDKVLQWDSYQVIKKELHRQYYGAKKSKGREHRARFLPLEHRLRISESVRAKWADPDYRNKVIESIQTMRKKGPRTFNDKLIDPEFDLILNSFTNLSAGSSNSLVSADSKVGSYNDPLSEEKLKKIKMLRERSTARKGLELETETVGFQFADFKVCACAASFKEKKDKAMYVEAQNPGCDDPMLGSAQTRDMVVLQQAQREAAQRARILLAEAERAAVLAAQALDAAGAHDDSLSDSLLEAWTLLDEANKSILNSKS